MIDCRRRIIIHLQHLCQVYNKDGYKRQCYYTCQWHCAVPENIHTPPTEGFLFCTPTSPRKFSTSLFSYIASENLAFKTPLPLGISNDLPWGGYGSFQFSTFCKNIPVTYIQVYRCAEHFYVILQMLCDRTSVKSLSQNL